MPIQFLIDELVEGPPSDQLRETVEQINERLRRELIPQQEARRLIALALFNEIVARYYSIPLENGSAQTVEVECRRAGLFRR